MPLGKRGVLTSEMRVPDEPSKHDPGFESPHYSRTGKRRPVKDEAGVFSEVGNPLLELT